MKLKLILLPCLTVFSFSVEANAECYCACVNNEMVSVCENSWDVGVYCSGTYCSGYKPENDNTQQVSSLNFLMKNDSYIATCEYKDKR